MYTYYLLQYSKTLYNPHNILSPYSILYLKILVVKLAQLAALSLSLRALQWPACTIYCYNIREAFIYVLAEFVR